MTDYTPLSRFRKFISRVSSLAVEFGNQLQLRGFKPGGSAGQVPRKSGSTDFTWTWSNLQWTDVAGKPTSFPPSTHTHPISQVVNLQAALDGKASLTGAVFTGNVTVSGIYVLSTSRMNLQGIPNSPDGLEPGDVWNDNGALMIV